MDCKTSHIPLEDQIAAMLRKSGVLVGPSIVEVPTNTHTENAMICRRFNHLSLEQLVKNCIGTDICGRPAVRIKIINSCTPLVDCVTNKDANPFRKMFAYDSTLKTFALVLNRSV